MVEEGEGGAARFLTLRGVIRETPGCAVPAAEGILGKKRHLLCGRSVTLWHQQALVSLPVMNACVCVCVCVFVCVCVCIP